METCCGYRYDRVRQHGTNLLTLPSDFHGQSGAHRTPQQVWSYAGIRRPYLRPTRFQGTHSVKKKRQLFPGLPPTSPSSFALPPTAEAASALRFGNFNPIPFRGLVPLHPMVQATRTTTWNGHPFQANRGDFPFPQDRLTRVQLLFTRNPSPLQSSRSSLEYLLLPPRSAPEAAPSMLAPRTALPRSQCGDFRALLLPGACTLCLPCRCRATRRNASAPSIFRAS